MCLAVPGKIIEKKENNKAIVDFDGVKRTVDLSFLKNPKIGEFVLVHVGFAIEKVKKKDAQESYKIVKDAINK